MAVSELVCNYAQYLIMLHLLIDTNKTENFSQEVLDYQQ